MCDVCNGQRQFHFQSGGPGRGYPNQANGLLTQAEALLSSGNLTSKQYDKLEDLRAAPSGR